MSTNNEKSNFDWKPYTIEELKTELKSYMGGLKFGFPCLDKQIRIPNGAVTIIAGRPGSGKTTFLMNLILNMIKQYPEDVFAYYCYEEGRSRIAVKMINILSDHSFSVTQFQDVMEGIRDDKNINPEIDDAIKTYRSYTEEIPCRLHLFSESHRVENLVEHIKALKQGCPNLKAVFIDYVQKISTNEKKDSVREIVMKVTQELRQSAQDEDIAIIAAAQMNRESMVKDKDNPPNPRLEHLKESGSIEEDANLVISIQQDGKSNDTTRKKIRIEVLKNRDGQNDIKKDSIIFYPQSLKMKED